MQKSKRITMIKDYLLTHKDVQVSDFTKFIDVSESTIRRDLRELANEGFLKELYGSVVLVERNDKDVLFDERMMKNLQEKNRIAKKAAAKIKDNSFIYVDAGSTTLQIIKYIEAKNVTVVTNGIHTALELAKHEIECHLLGGELKVVTMAIIGEEAVDSMSKMYFDISFIGTNGNSEVGFSTPDIREGILKAKVVERSRSAFVLADSTKKDKTTSFVFASRDECGLIVD